MTVVEAKLVEGPFHRRCSMLKNPNCSKFEAQGTVLRLKPFSCNSEVSICVKILKKDDKTTINKQRNKNCNGCECFATIMFNVKSRNYEEINASSHRTKFKFDV